MEAYLRKLEKGNCNRRETFHWMGLSWDMPDPVGIFTEAALNEAEPHLLAAEKAVAPRK